jgi:hypothetical protein
MACAICQKCHFDSTSHHPLNSPALPRPCPSFTPPAPDAAHGYDLEYLDETVRARVLESSGVRLEGETKRLGLFRPGQEVQEFLGQML